MTVAIIQDGVTLGLRGNDNDAGEFIFASFQYGAASVDSVFFTACRQMKVEDVRGFVTAAGSDGGAVTAVVRKVPSGVALASGVALHAGTFNLKGTAVTQQALALTSTGVDLLLNAGDSLAVDFTGTLTGATGNITVGMNPV